MRSQPLVVGAGAGVVHHERNGLGQVHGAAAADTDNAGNGFEFGLSSLPVYLHSWFGFVGNVGEDDLVVTTQGHLAGEGLPSKMIRLKYHRTARFAVRAMIRRVG